MCSESGERGLTLIELVISIVILAVAAVALYTALGLVAGHSSDPLIDEQATAIASAYLEEISSKAFVDPSLAANAPACSGPVESRPQMNNICDYNGLVDIGAHDQQGQAIAGLGNYTITVAVYNPTSAWQGITATDVLRIDIQVTYVPTGQNYVLTGLRTRY